MDVWGSLNISPAWFQQAHETMQDWPEAAAIFRKPAALERLDAISQPNSILSAILAVIHPPLHKAGQETFNQLRQHADIQPQDVLCQWTSVFNSVTVICNRLTPPHRDGNSRRQWNKVKLQVYQQEYAQRKRAPGHRKLSKAERVLLEEQQVQKSQLMKMEDLPVRPRAAFDRCISPPVP
ncbi:hypothetical protein EI94DRAFT_1807967 [Lactarius quietus]|nr:hypothetical protein EI94DRAFT_1807967 [Lactarius quietus]